MDINERVKTLIDSYGQNDQRTAAWHTKRGEMLTASEIYKTVAGATPAARRELIVSKLTPRDSGSSGGARSLLWGTQFEPVAKQIYENMHKVRIVDTTCVPHPVHSFLGASPDGLQLDNPERFGRLVEFKCPISRDFDETTPVPEMYIHQMQLQMACTGMDACDYAEFKFKIVNYSEWVDTDVKYKSALIGMSDGSFHYRSPEDPRSVTEWKNQVLRELGCDDVDGFQLVWWVLVKTRFHSVDKDHKWLETNLPFFEQTWKEVQEHRQNGTLPDNPRDKTVLTL
jgi:putative phage-type endonuclease